jgi:hypothetical protein
MPIDADPAKQVSQTVLDEVVQGEATKVPAGQVEQERQEDFEGSA